MTKLDLSFRTKREILRYVQVARSLLRSGWQNSCDDKTGFVISNVERNLACGSGCKIPPWVGMTKFVWWQNWICHFERREKSCVWVRLQDFSLGRDDKIRVMTGFVISNVERNLACESDCKISP